MKRRRQRGAPAMVLDAETGCVRASGYSSRPGQALLSSMHPSMHGDAGGKVGRQAGSR